MTPVIHPPRTRSIRRIGRSGESAVAPAARRIHRALLGTILGIACCGLLRHSPAAAAELATAKEHQIKAAFVYNFLKFVEWPVTRFETTNSPVIIGVVGNSSITAALQSTVRDRSINGREILVRAVDSVDAAKAAHILFLPAADDKRVGEYLSAVAESGVLTVGESGSFAAAGGMINFVIDGDKVRFEINLNNANRAGLRLSSQLLKLARNIRSDG